ncbi:UbiE/COQ5 methyltransferase [uncultured Desulfobacterium sp.]|uniref:Arsenite methyltransferase n=1 Tax=uncultured Desulfobacterium sp. TaxID=201089 RepID=A0A445N3S5_9BACT|nr:UbiE/COQ5 methyltransferase [uncultured Desulfobacterium sp.]
METKTREDIRKAVQESYGKVARTGGIGSGTTLLRSCCGLTQISLKPRESNCCGPQGVSVERLSQTLGYTKEDLDSVPDGANMGLGCGNPVAIASLKPGETVVDLGSGGGFDCFLAARAVGPNGRVIGVDMTPDMVQKARENARNSGVANVEFRLGEIEHLPVADNTADVIMSNCVINLSPDKLSVYREAFRVLKPGGRLAISDILATTPLPDEISNDLDLVCACLGGATTIGDTEQMLRQSGFQDINIKTHTLSPEIFREWGAGNVEKAVELLVSVYVEATKPY